MERSLTHRLPAKVAALFLVVILTFGLGFSGVITVMSLNYRLYSDDISVFQDTTACYSEVMSDLYNLRRVMTGESTYMETYYGTLDECSLRFAGYDPQTGKWLSNDANVEQALRLMMTAKGDILAEHAKGGYLLVEPGAVEPVMKVSADGYGLPRMFYEEIDGIVFLASVIEPPHGWDSYHRESRMFELVYGLYEIAPIALVTFLFALIALVIFLCCAAGHRYGREGIYANYQDRIPLDVYLTAMVFAVGTCLAGIIELTYSAWNMEQVILVCLCGTATAMLFLATLLTLATRFKLGRWWRNTLIWQCCRLTAYIFRSILRAIRRGWYSLRLTWRVALAAALLLFFLPILARGAVYLALAALLVVLACSVARQMLQLKQAGQALAEGDFDQDVDTTRLRGELREHGENLNSLGRGLSIAVEQKMRSERMKTELITNVSHDIKTPLTSIINYVDLLQKDPTPEEQAEYLAVLDRQAKRLKKLTEDLVEASKASTGNLSCTLAPTNLHEILDQALGEYEDRLQAAGLEPVLTLPEEDLSVMADGRLLWRVLDNLLNNACKYAQSGTRLYLDVRASADSVSIFLKNISRQPLNLSPDELMERFVRGDSSRNTEGSGLGLNIAKSLVELQGGVFSLAIDGDLFKAAVTLPRCF